MHLESLRQHLRIRGEDDTKQNPVSVGLEEAAKAAFRWAKTSVPCSELQNFIHFTPQRIPPGFGGYLERTRRARRLPSVAHTENSRLME